MPRQCVFFSQLASDHSMLGIGQAMAPALRVQTDTPRIDLGCVSIRGVSRSMSWRTWPLPRIMEAWEDGEVGGKGGHSWWGLTV